MKTAYGVVWREAGTARSGQLVVGSDSLRLVGTGDAGAPLCELPFDDIFALEVRVAEAEHSTIVLRSRVVGRVEIESAAEKWLLVELFEKAFLHSVAAGPERQRLLVAVRLKPGCREAAVERLRSGPPFEAVATAIAAHDVFVLEDEVLFFFETNEHETSEGQSQGFWDAVTAWRELLDKVQVAEHVYSWTRAGHRAGQTVHIGLGL